MQISIPGRKPRLHGIPERPHTIDYIDELIVDFTPLGGDRYFGEDLAIIGGLGQFHGRTVMIMGHEKGADTQGRLKHNFGMAKPEGYRKAVRLMEMADRFSIPVISLVDTAGAYPGIEAEERGQAEAIARSTDCCLSHHRAHDLGHHRRGRLRRRHRHSVGEPRADAGALHLQRDFAGGRRLDPVARQHQGQGCGDRHENHRARPASARHHRRHHRRAGWRRAPRSGTAIQRVGEAMELALLDFDNMDGASIRKLRREKFLNIGKSLPVYR